MARISTCLLFLITPLILYAQNPHGNYDPFVSSGSISPVPLTTVGAGGNGVFTFNTGNSGHDPLVVFIGHRIVMTITLSYGVANNVDPLRALGGTSANLYAWEYSNGTYTGRQIATVPSHSSGTITIDYRVTRNSSQNDPKNGFHVNITPAPYQTTRNNQNNDAFSVYTWTEIRDYGDTPSGYGSANHVIDYINYLGELVDGENGNQPSAAANADDLGGTDDEDGVVFPILRQGEAAVIPVIVVGEGYLNAWIDWNGDTDFNDGGERIVTDRLTGDVIYNISITVPANAIISSPTFARFRFGPRSSTNPSYNSTGSSSFGEVEDYQITILCSLPGIPSIGTITQTTCVLATGSVVVNNLPAGAWTLSLIPGGQNTSGTGTSRTISGIEPGTYNFTVTSSSGCTSAPSVNFVINSQPSMPGAPLPGTIVAPTCSLHTGSVALGGLPSGSWTLNRSPGSVITTGSGTSTVISGLQSGIHRFTVSTNPGCISVPSVDVTIPAPPLLPATPSIGTITQPGCLTATGSVVLNGLPSAGNWILTRNPGSIFISGLGTSITDQELIAGTYTYTVTNSDGCTSGPTNNVVINARPSIPGSPTQSIDCSFGFDNAVVNVLYPLGTGLQYRLDEGNYQTSATFSDVNNGMHTVTVRNASGCTVNGSPFSVSCGCVNGPVLTLLTRNGATCISAPAIVSGNTFGGNATSVTITENGAGSVFPSVINSSPFTFTYTPAPGDEGKTVIITLTTNNPLGSPCTEAIVVYPLTVNALPGTPVVGNISHPSCTSSTGTVSFSGLPATGTWNLIQSPGAVSTAGSGTTAIISGLNSGYYTFMVTNSTGCTSLSSPTVQINPQPLIPPAPTAGNIIQPTCTVSTGSSVLNGLPASGAWTLTRYPGTVALTGTGTSITIPELQSGTYNFTVTSAGGCASIPSANIVINQQPTTPGIPVPGAITQPTCSIPSGRVFINGLPASGQWTLNSVSGGITLSGTGSSVTVPDLIPGTYAFTVTNAAGCISAQTTNVIIPQIPNAPTLVITPPQPACSPATIDLTAASVTAGSTAGLVYSYWTNPATTISYSTPSQATTGTYYIKGTNSLFCSDIKPVVVSIKEKPIAEAGPDQSLNYTFSAALGANEPGIGETGKWSLSTGSGSFINSAMARTSITGLGIGQNILLWTVSNGVCLPATDFITLTVIDLIIPTLITPNNDGKNENFFLKGIESQKEKQLTIFDRRGVLVYKSMDYNNKWNGVDNNGKPLPDDTYFYLLRLESGKSRAGYIVIRR